MAYGDTEKTKIAECRLYTAGWGFGIVTVGAIVLSLISAAEAVTTRLPFFCAGLALLVGYPCVVLAAWGDAIKDVIDHVLSLFKKGEKE